jgi:hypothetical protein
MIFIILLQNNYHHHLLILHRIPRKTLSPSNATGVFMWTIYLEALVANL